MTEWDEKYDEWKRDADASAGSAISSVAAKAAEFKKGLGALLASGVAVAATLGFGADSKIVAGVVALAAVFGVVVAPKNAQS